MKSIFDDKDLQPTNTDLRKALAGTFCIWQGLIGFIEKLYPGPRGEWHFSGPKYGWSFRVSDKKRVLLYLLPRDKYFKVAFVFGRKATDAILKSNIAEPFRTEIGTAKVYAEGRGIRIDVKDGSMLEDIQNLIAIKISN